jgi:hypothetical protein
VWTDTIGKEKTSDHIAAAPGVSQERIGLFGLARGNWDSLALGASLCSVDASVQDGSSAVV